MAAACAAAARMFAYNATLCACDPGYYLSNGTACVSLPTAGGGGGAFSDWQVGAVGAGSRNQTLYFLAPVLSLDAVRRLTQSQAQQKSPFILFRASSRTKAQSYSQQNSTFLHLVSICRH
jgi:hypothetical protein